MGTSAPDPFVLGGGLPGDPDLRLCYLGYGSRGRAGKARVGCWMKVKTCVFPIFPILLQKPNATNTWIVCFPCLRAWGADDESNRQAPTVTEKK